MQTDNDKNKLEVITLKLKSFVDNTTDNLFTFDKSILLRKYATVIMQL